MIFPKDIHSLSDFQRNAKAHIKRLKKSGAPSVLTVNGRPSVIVQDAVSYEKMLARIDRVSEFEAVRRALEEVDAGNIVPHEIVARQMRAKYSKRAQRKSA